MVSPLQSLVEVEALRSLASLFPDIDGPFVPERVKWMKSPPPPPKHNKEGQMDQKSSLQSQNITNAQKKLTQNGTIGIYAKRSTWEDFKECLSSNSCIGTQYYKG
eukprot:scaffold581_cov24-Tisochrysis_lutea.AAC.4